uniref:Ribosomal protein L34 n=1 Tax=Ceramothamnion japonicum TaxID=218448 RepID=A0A1C9CDE0_CERJP|nr:ribosomal protein L34 [Ceramium japonicum]AOM66408.1 ribosomal protein L34 [Ceramium japonicum]
MNKGTNLKKRRQSGFRSRMKQVSGRKIIKSRRQKKRNKISL